jgi:hypothetical protein
MVSAVSSGRQDDATEYPEDGEHDRKAGTAGTAIRRQLLSIGVRRGPGRLIS